MDLCILRSICFQLHDQHTYQLHQPSPTTGPAVNSDILNTSWTIFRSPEQPWELRDSLCDNSHQNKLPLNLCGYLWVSAISELCFFFEAYELSNFLITPKSPGRKSRSEVFSERHECATSSNSWGAWCRHSAYKTKWTWRFEFSSKYWICIPSERPVPELHFQPWRDFGDDNRLNFYLYFLLESL